jgi:hypothetical protein
VIPHGFETGYPASEQRVWCVRRAGGAKTLCLLQVVIARASGYFPGGDLQPSDPSTQCPRCAAALEALAVSGGIGVCPACCEPAAVVDGVVVEHDECPGGGTIPGAVR